MRHVYRDEANRLQLVKGKAPFSYPEKDGYDGIIKIHRRLPNLDISAPAPKDLTIEFKDDGSWLIANHQFIQGI